MTAHEFEHDGCWFCQTPTCDTCPDLPDRHQVLRRDAWVTACPDCSGIDTSVDHGPSCQDCGAPGWRDCFDTCPSWVAREREDMAAHADEAAHERQWGAA